MSHPMKNMKIEAKPADEALYGAEASGGMKYPYGLRITLGPEVLEKLDLVKLPEVGQMMGLHAVVEVVGVNLENAENGGRDKRVELQITDLCLKDRSDDSLNKTILGG
jgi:hypothetical protein